MSPPNQWIHSYFQDIICNNLLSLTSHALKCDNHTCAHLAVIYETIFHTALVIVYWWNKRTEDLNKQRLCSGCICSLFALRINLVAVAAKTVILAATVNTWLWFKVLQVDLILIFSDVLMSAHHHNRKLELKTHRRQNKNDWGGRINGRQETFSWYIRRETTLFTMWQHNILVTSACGPGQRSSSVGCVISSKN